MEQVVDDALPKVNIPRNSSATTSTTTTSTTNSSSAVAIEKSRGRITMDMKEGVAPRPVSGIDDTVKPTFRETRRNNDNDEDYSDSLSFRGNVSQQQEQHNNILVPGAHRVAGINSKEEGNEYDDDNDDDGEFNDTSFQTDNNSNHVDNNDRTITATTDSSLVMAEVVDHVNEMEELRRAVKEDTEIQVRKEILSNVTSAEQVHVISENDKEQQQKVKLCIQRYRWYILCCTLILVAVAVAVGVTVSSSDKKETGESSTTATSPPGPANWVPIGGDLNGKVATFSGGSVSLSSSGTILAFGNLMLQEGEFDLVETSKFGGVEVYQLVDNVAWVHRGDWDNHITQSIEGCCHSVAMDEEGTTLVVGAPGNGMNDTGLVQVFRYDGDTTPWQTIGSAISGLDSPLTWGGEQFGYSVSLSSNGTVLASGAPNYVYEGNDSATLGQVRVYRFRHDVDQWQPVGQFLDDGFEYQYSRFGSSVALSAAGDILAVGAPDFDSPFDHAGQVQVFRLQSDEWIRIGDPLYGEGRLDRLGISVALSADGLTLAAGAPGNKKDEDTFSGMGHVRVYKLFGNDWSQIGQDIDGFLQFGRLGSSVALSADGSYVVVGAPGIQTGLGRVFKFQADEGVWEKVGDDLEGEYVNDAFGTSVAVSNDGSIVSVGAPFNQEGRNVPNGHVRSFRLAG